MLWDILKQHVLKMSLRPFSYYSMYVSFINRVKVRIKITSFLSSICPLYLFVFLRPEKMAKLPVILGNLDVTIDNVAPDLPSESNLALLLLMQFIFTFIWWGFFLQKDPVLCVLLCLFE